jgi:hypothetical protein
MQQYNVSDLILRYFAAFLEQEKKILEEGLSDDIVLQICPKLKVPESFLTQVIDCLSSQKVLGCDA